MATEDRKLGRIGIKFAGEYDSSKTYTKWQTVAYNGSSYILKVDEATGIDPTNKDYWIVSAKKGDKGDTPKNGIDYNTPSEKEEFKNDVVENATSDLESYITDKKSELDEYKESKITELNDYTSTQKTELNSYSEGLINSFNTNATNKTDDFNNNSKTKIAEFSQNAVSKTDTFNSNANAKTQAFNENVETQTNEFEEVVNSTLSSFESETSQYVKNTDYANANKGGVIKTGYCFGVATNGVPVCGAIPYSTYINALDGTFIGKGTLENVLNAKIGSIDTILDTINGEVI